MGRIAVQGDNGMRLDLEHVCNTYVCKTYAHAGHLFRHLHQGSGSAFQIRTGLSESGRAVNTLLFMLCY